jgi:hypothetical protein
MVVLVILACQMQHPVPNLQEMGQLVEVIANQVPALLLTTFHYIKENQWLLALS